MISYSYVRQTRQTKFASYLVNFYVHGRIVNSLIDLLKKSWNLKTLLTTLIFLLIIIVR